MPREKFEHELQRLKDEILALGAMAESVRALKERDTAKAHIEIATELEPIADYAKGIANVTLALSEEPLIKPLEAIPRMADKACDMLHRALDSFMRQDVEEARGIPPEDMEVDSLYEQTYRELITIMISDPQTTDQANRLTWVAHNLERSADRVGNICERIVFSITGHGEELDGPLLQGQP